MIDLTELITPSYSDLEDGNFCATLQEIRYKDMLIIADVDFWYNMQIDRGDYYTPSYEFATLDHVHLSDIGWYDLDGGVIEVPDSTQAVILDKIEKEIIKQIDHTI